MVNWWPGTSVAIDDREFDTDNSEEKEDMIQNFALIAWPLLMVLTAIIPVVLGLREYRRTR